MQGFNNTSFQISEQVTKSYSTSFYSATRLLDKDTRYAIFSIYGFVRFADEIVDTFHEFDKKYLLEKFETDYYDSVKQGISLNPILQSFQKTVQKYNIPDAHIQAFLSSMKYDLVKSEYKDKTEVNEYIYGSADVVGLMCLKVFCNGDDTIYNELEKPAQKLGSAFQKVNFLRDLKNDMEILDRKYFPEIQQNRLNEDNKLTIIADIESNFDSALVGIKKLPNRSKLAVLVAYYYYRSLLKKIKNTPAERIFEYRIRISNTKKLLLLLKAILLYKLRLIS